MIHKSVAPSGVNAAAAASARRKLSEQNFLSNRGITGNVDVTDSCQGRSTQSKLASKVDTEPIMVTKDVGILGRESQEKKDRLMNEKLKGKPEGQKEEKAEDEDEEADSVFVADGAVDIDAGALRVL